MTEERKQELAELLEEAMESLVVRRAYHGPPSLPVHVYRRYLEEERWKYCGADFLSFALSTRFMPDIEDEITKSNLLDFIRKELAQFIDGDDILITVCDIESSPTDGAYLSYRVYPRLYLYFLMERLLEIAIVRGIEGAVSVFDRCSCPEGTHDLFQDVTLLEGMEIEAEVQVFEGVRLVPLSSREISEEIALRRLGVSFELFADSARHFFGKTLLVIDRPGFTVFWKPSERAFQNGTDINELPFQVEVPDVKFPNSNEVDSFKKLFCQALSLVCNAPVQIFRERWFLAEDKSFNPYYNGSGMLQYITPLRSPIMAREEDIEKAKYLYCVLDKNSDIREKLRIPIDGWIKATTQRKTIGPITDKNPPDKLIDLGIALEALYLSDIEEPTELSFRLRLHAAWHLGENEEDRRALMKEFSEIYNWRSKVVHTGKLPNKTKKTTFTPGEIDKFIERAQDLCRESIMKILEDGEFPNWNSLILGGEVGSEVEDSGGSE